MNQSQQPSASLPNRSSKLPTNDTVVSIVHHTNSKPITQDNDELVAIVEYPPSLEDYEIRENHQPPDVPIEKQWLEQLLSPWGIGSLLILLSANILLSWAQWSTEKTPANTTSQSNQTSEQLSVSEPINTPTQNPDKLALDRLSLLSVSSTSPKNTPNSSNKAAKATLKPSASVAAKTKGATNLTNALLPPSLQPQLVQTYPTSGVPPRPPLSQALPVNPPSQPPQVYPSTQNAPVPASSVPSNPDQKFLLQQERVFEQMRVREQQPTPLGFNNRYQAELRARQNKQNPSEVIDQLQKVQEQRIDETKTTNPIATDKPAQ